MEPKKQLLSELIAELLGSMFLVMAAISPIILFRSVLHSSIEIAVIADALAVGFVLCALIEIFGPISGAHFNPAVTFAMLLSKKIELAKAGLFVVFQIIGGLLGTLASHLMFFNQVRKIVAVSVIERSNYVFCAEVFGTFILVLAIFLLVKAGSTKLPIIIGLLVGGQLMATSSTMFANPQVTIARMFTYSDAGIRPIDGLVFIAMQLIGAFLAVMVNKLFSRQAQTIDGKLSEKRQAAAMKE